MDINLKKVWGVLHNGSVNRKNPMAKIEALRQCFGYANNFVRLMDETNNSNAEADFRTAAEAYFLRTLECSLEKGYPQDLILKVLNEKSNKRLKTLFRYGFEKRLPNVEDLQKTQKFIKDKFEERQPHF